MTSDLDSPSFDKHTIIALAILKEFDRKQIPHEDRLRSVVTLLTSILFQQRADDDYVDSVLGVVVRDIESMREASRNLYGYD